MAGVPYQSDGMPGEQMKDRMSSRLKKIAFHTILLIAILVVMTAVAIWFGLGPVVHSSPALN